MSELVYINNEEVTPQIFSMNQKPSGFYKVTNATLRLDEFYKPIVEGTWVEITEEEYKQLVEEQINAG